jgi:2'-5' RNA ligase
VPQKRLFIAVPLPDHLKDKLAVYLDSVRPKAKLQWSFPENLHLTLAFLGDTDELQIPLIESAIDQAAAAGETFDLDFEEIGAFPSLKKPRVLFLKPKTTLAITRLANTLRAELAGSKIPHDPKPFTPHLTLARNPYGSHVPSLPKPANLTLKVDKIVLFESRLTKPHSTYEVLYEKGIS